MSRFEFLADQLQRWQQRNEKQSRALGVPFLHPIGTVDLARPPPESIWNNLRAGISP